MAVTSLVDSWLLLRNLETNGERNRLIFVRKARGSAHSNQVREFVLTANGPQLLDVYIGAQGVLTGSAQTRAAGGGPPHGRTRDREEVDRRRRHLAVRTAEADARIAALRSELEAEAAEVAYLTDAYAGPRGRLRHRGRDHVAAPMGRPGRRRHQRRTASACDNDWSGRHRRCGLDGRVPTHPARQASIDPLTTDPAELFALRLYIAGLSPKCVRAIDNLKHVCEEHLAGRYSIEVIDLLVQPQLASGDEIVAVPTLVRQLPQPIRRIIGDLSDTEKVLVGLQLRPRERGW